MRCWTSKYLASIAHIAWDYCGGKEEVKVKMKKWKRILSAARILESRLPLLLGIAGSIVGGLIARLSYSSGDTGGAYGRTSQTGTAQTWLNVSTNLETTSQ